MRRIVGRTGVASLRQAMYLPFWYTEQWRPGTSPAPWPPFVPVLVAGSISVGPLALFVLPQAKGR